VSRAVVNDDLVQEGDHPKLRSGGNPRPERDRVAERLPARSESHWASIRMSEPHEVIEAQRSWAVAIVTNDPEQIKPRNG